MRISTESSGFYVVVLLAFFAAVALLFTGAYRMSSANEAAYEALQLNGRVEKIIGYNRGYPIVLISSRRRYISRLPSAFSNYVAIGDSITKRSGSFVVVSYRKKGNCTEIVTWQYALKNGYEQPDIRKQSVCR